MQESRYEHVGCLWRMTPKHALSSTLPLNLLLPSDLPAFLSL